MKFGRYAAFVLSGVMLIVNSLSAQEVSDPILRNADTLIKAGKPVEAYALLEPMEFKRSGEIRFDYLLGIAALDSGKPDKATLAFERVLAMDPNFAGARLDMARAYYQLGDLPRAKTEFATVLTQSPPEAARVTIQKYLDGIAALERAQKTQISGYVEGAFGHDSNIASTSTQSYTMPNTATFLPGQTIAPASNLSGNYGGINTGFDINHLVNERLGIFGSADVRQHSNSKQTMYDSGSLDTQMGVSYSQEKHTFKLTLSGGLTESGQTMRRETWGAGAAWQYALSPSDQLNAFTQWGQNRASGYPATSPTTDARIEGDTDQTILGAGWVHVMNDGKQMIFTSVFGGTETPKAPVTATNTTGGRPDGKKDFYGLRIGGQIAFSDAWDGFVSVGSQSAQFGTQHPTFGVTRNETQLDLTLGLVLRPTKAWTVKPQLALSSKNSNISLYSFNRTDASLTVRRDFK